MLADPFRDDVTRSFERFVNIGDAACGIHESRGEFRERLISRLLFPEVHSKRFQTPSRAIVALVRRFGLYGR